MSKTSHSVHTPWLTPDEAAFYCRISPSLFNQLRKEVPIKTGGRPRRPRFHRKELDHWMERGFKQEDTFQKGKEKRKKNNGNQNGGSNNAPLELV